MRPVLTLALALFALPIHGLAERARSPGDATVFIRLSGSARIEVDDSGSRRTVDLDRLEIGTGSGFLFSPDGYVLTNHHVVHDPESFVLTRGALRATVSLTIERIDVCFRPDVMTSRGLSPACSAGSVVASDRALDLAVLFVGGSNLPYVGLGDSDAAAAGLPVDALGYPFGRAVEVGKIATARDLVPEVSVTPGAISAFRANDAGERRFLQVTNTLNPGNSGGPLVTRDGFAVGVISMKLEPGTGIGFAIPVNLVKDFLETSGLEHFVPARRLRLGAMQDYPVKAIGLRMPDGFTDASPFRSQVETGPSSAEIALRIDRVLTPWHARRLEDALVGTPSFEAGQMAPREIRTASAPVASRLLLGAAAGEAADGSQEFRMDYAILDLGAEKLVARYVGSAEAMALNESVLRESLLSLKGQALQAGGPVPPEKLEWSGAPAAISIPVPLPAGWVVEPGRPSACTGLPPPSAFASASAPRDLTVVLRAAAWTGVGLEPRAAAAACSARPGSLGEASYTLRDSWLGTTYVVEGVFLQMDAGRILQAEVVSPERSAARAADLLAAWVKRISAAPST